MTVPRSVKLQRRRMRETPPALERSWVILTLVPAVLVGVLLWLFLVAWL